MKARVVSGVLLVSLCFGLFSLALNIQPVRASGTIFIRPDGTVDGTDKIQQDGNIYTFTDSIYDSIVVERSHIIIDGDKYTLESIGLNYGFHLTANDVTIQNINVKGFDYGIYVESSNNTISGSNITDNRNRGIWLYGSSFNTISDNKIANSDRGIGCDSSSNNKISGNHIANNDYYGICLQESSDNNMHENNITANKYGGIVQTWFSNYNNISGNTIINDSNGIYIDTSSYNTVFNNNIRNNKYGICLCYSSNYSIVFGNNLTNNLNGVRLASDSLYNTFYHNNFLSNTHQVVSYDLMNFWDNGYPSGGNYWSDYTGTDADDDGIGDVPYIIDAYNQDNYPLIYPWSSVERKVGVEVGDWVKYANFDVTWSSNDPDSEIPLGITLLEETEWWENSVEDVLDTQIRYQQLFHFKNGSEFATTCWINMETASGTPVSFISSGLNPSDNLYSSAPWFAWKINETQTRSYIGVLRETNCLSITAPMQIGPPPPYPNSTGSFYWDRETGVLCELSMKHVNKTGNYVTSWSVFYEIVDTNLWQAPIPITIDDLKTAIEDLGSEGEIARQGIVRSFIAKLKIAEKLVDKGKTDEAVLVLGDFIMQVQELSGIHITVEAADILIESAEYILSHL